MRYILLFILLLCKFSGFGQETKWIPFNWEGADISGRQFNKIAITVPVTLDKLPYKFKMQLDLGAVESMIYGQSFLPYLDTHSSLKNKIDTSQTFKIQDKAFPFFKNIDLKLGNVSFGKKNIGYFKDFGDSISKDSLNSKNEQFIGTLAPDIFQDKILIIDFPNQKLCIAHKLTKAYSQVQFQDFKIKNGRIKIPFDINGKTEDIMFDTGSSLFSLVTTQENANKIAKPTIIDSLEVSSWGKLLTFYGQQTNVPIKFGNLELPQTIVYFDDQNSSEQLFKDEQIWGITGNMFFLKNIVVIDYKNKKFGIK